MITGAFSFIPTKQWRPGMKTLFRFAVISFFALLIPTICSADVSALMKQADSLFSYDGSFDNYKKSIELYKQVLTSDPNNFEANWKCARSIRFYANKAEQTSMKDWKKICATMGKEGMGYAQKAIDLNPQKPDGYYYYALNVGIYADGVSIVKALKEGLKDKTQKSFEKVITLDKSYEKYAGLVGLGRFWYVLPWPLSDKKKSLDYFRQYQKSGHFGEEPEGVVYLAELLIDLGGKDNKAEAKKILTDLKTNNGFFKKYAKDLLEKV
jgi:tetratricopeptide (TPR) repeat protein